MDRRKAVILLLITVLLWSTSGLFVKILNWHPLAVSGVRSAIAALVIWAYIRRPNFVWSLPLIGGALAYLGAQSLFVAATTLTSAANAIFLQYTAPIYVVLLAYWLLREKPSRTDWISMGIIFLGLLLFFGDQLSPDGFYGNILAVLSGLTSAVMMVSFRAQKNSTPEDSVLIASLVIAVFGFPSVLKESWTISNWSVVAYLGIFQIGVAFIFFTKGIKHIQALEANLIGTLEPILNPVWVFLFLGEQMGKSALLGGLVVLVGVIVSAVGSARTDKEFEAASIYIHE